MWSFTPLAGPASYGKQTHTRELVSFLNGSLGFIAPLSEFVQPSFAHPYPPSRAVLYSLLEGARREKMAQHTIGQVCGLAVSCPFPNKTHG